MRFSAQTYKAKDSLSFKTITLLIYCLNVTTNELFFVLEPQQRSSWGCYQWRWRWRCRCRRSFANSLVIKQQSRQFIFVLTNTLIRKYIYKIFQRIIHVSEQHRFNNVSILVYRNTRQHGAKNCLQNEIHFLVISSSSSQILEKE